jgi:ABC-2 type transport system ATP-binding protein
MLELRNVCKHYSSIPAVEGVSFSARAGEVTGYLGPNGSGKSTTMKMITGLIEMSSGSILFQGKPIQDDLMAYKQRMGYVPEEPYLYAHLSGVEYLVMVGQLRDIARRVASERIDAIVALLCALRRSTCSDLRVFQRDAPEGLAGRSPAAQSRAYSSG